MNTSIKYKKLEIAPLSADGSIGTEWTNCVDSAREGTAQFQGSSADSTIHKNVQGETLDISRTKGEMTVNWQTADMTPTAIAMLTGGTATTDAEGDNWSPAEDENQSIYLSVRITSSNNVEYTLPKVSIDTFPMVNDDDLHYFQVEGTVVKPATGKSFTYRVLKAAKPSS